MSELTRPRVTVAIPTWNRAPLLRECLKGVLAQSLTDIEVFVSDNASTDETAAVVDSLQDTRVNHARLGRNIGLYGNLSRCLQLGTAPYVALLPDDDLMLPENLERKVRVLEENPDVDLVHSAVQVRWLRPDGTALEEVGNTGRSESDTVEAAPVVLRRMLTEPYRMNFISVVMRRSLIGDDGFDEADRAPADFGLCLRLTSRARAIGYVAEPLVVTTRHAKAASIKEDEIYAFEDGQYRPTLAAWIVWGVVKERFLTHHAGDLSDRKELLRTVHRINRRRLVRWVRGRAGGAQRTRGSSFRAFCEAARVYPRLIASAEAMSFLLGELVGARGRRLVRRLLGHPAGQMR